MRAHSMHGQLAAFALMVLVMAACGDDDDCGRTPSPVPATATIPQPSRTPANSPTPTSAPPTTTATVAPSATATPTPASTDTPTASPTATEPVPVATLEGPITPNNPFVQSTNFPLAEVGYMQAEFFIAGTARSFAAAGELTPDGVWGVAVGTASAAYKTRFVVYRPIDAANFNGSVVMEWLNVSGGLDAAPDWTSTHTELIREGYAWIGVSAQFVGVEGRGGPGPIPGLPDLSLKSVNPARYGSLVHPGDTFSYDIFSQVAEAVRRPTDIDPLGGLTLERLLAAGESQSAFRMVTYINAIHPLTRLFDGFLVHSRGGGSAALSQYPQTTIATPDVVRIRGDLDVPVLTFQTETDLLILNFLPDRQEDTPLFRLWEVAGTSHADTYTLRFGFTDRGTNPTVAVVQEIADPIPGIIVCDLPVNAGPQHFVLKAAIAALDRWIREGVPPPTAPRLEVGGTPAQFALDEHGNVRGGIRTPYVDAPVAVLSGLGQTGGGFCAIFGTTRLFDEATFNALYADQDAYVTAVSAATDAAVEAGFILPADAPLIKAAAELQ